jgi:hypothetical protein
MAGSANKKVQVVRFDRATLAGFVQVPEGLASGGVELLTPEGNLVHIPFSETKAVCFVKDLDDGMSRGREPWMHHRAFQTRPKTAGLWVRMRFRDGDTLEGIVPSNLMLLEATAFSAIPPDPTFQLQRVLVPREALTSVDVLGVIGSGARRWPAKPVDREKQIQLFE